MARMYLPQNQRWMTPPPPQPPRRRPPRATYEFRWVLYVLIPGALLLTLWFISGVEPSCRWDDVMTALHVRDRQQYTQLMVLGLVISAICLIARILRGPRKDDDQT